MKAIKITSIDWNKASAGEGVDVENLPNRIAFYVNDDYYDVPTNVPRALKKKYNCGINNLSFTDFVIPETIKDLVKCFDKSDKAMVSSSSGKITIDGTYALNKIEREIRNRKAKDEKGTDPWSMKKSEDIIMLGCEKVLGISWDKSTATEIVEKFKEKFIEEFTKLYKKKLEMDKLSKEKIKADKKKKKKFDDFDDRYDDVDNIDDIDMDDEEGDDDIDEEDMDV